MRRPQSGPRRRGCYLQVVSAIQLRSLSLFMPLPDCHDTCADRSSQVAHTTVKKISLIPFAKFPHIVVRRLSVTGGTSPSPTWPWPPGCTRSPGQEHWLACCRHCCNRLHLCSLIRSVFAMTLFGRFQLTSKQPQHKSATCSVRGLAALRASTQCNCPPCVQLYYCSDLKREFLTVSPLARSHGGC